MPQVGIIDSAASGAHLSHVPDKAEIMWNFPMRKKKNVVTVLMPAGSCQKWSPYLEMA